MPDPSCRGMTAIEQVTFDIEPAMYDISLLNLIRELAWFLRVMERYESSEKLFNSLHEFDQDKSFSLLGLGVLSADQGQFDKARGYFGEVLQTYPGHSLANAYIGLLMAISGDRRHVDYFAQAADATDEFGGQALAGRIMNILAPEAEEHKTGARSQAPSLARLSVIKAKRDGYEY